jgi:hypothetical protein
LWVQGYNQNKEATKKDLVEKKQMRSSFKEKVAYNSMQFKNSIKDTENVK